MRTPQASIGEAPPAILTEPTIPVPTQEGLTSDNYNRYAAEINIEKQRANGLLDLRQGDQELIDQVAQNGQIDLADQTKTENNRRAQRYHLARAKQDIAISVDSGVGMKDMSENAKRLLLLNHLIGKGSEDNSARLIRHDKFKIADRASFMDQTLDDKWKTSGSILLSRSLKTLQRKVELYDKHFGTKWHKYSKIMIPSDRTVIASKRTLAYMGITLENTTPGAFFSLVGRSMELKQKRAIFIRRSILGHTQIRNASQKRRKSTMVARRQNQSEADKELEVQEIEDLRKFFRDIGSRYLVLSTQEIATKAYEKDYYNRRIRSAA